MNRSTFSLALLASILASAAPAFAAAKGNPAVLEWQQMEAQNRGDVAGVLALFSDDAVLQGAGLCVAAPCVGKEAIGKDIERRVAIKSHATIIASYGSGNVAAVQLAVSGAGIEKAGVTRIILWNICEARGEKLAAVTAVFQRTDPQTAKFLRWLRSQPPAR